MSQRQSKVKSIALATLCAAVIAAGGLATIGTPVYADASDEVQAGFEAAGGTGSESLTSIVGTVINTMLFIVGILSVIMIIYAGIRFITAGGNAQQVATAKKILIYSVVGLVVAICSYTIVNFVIGKL